jgi:sugar phosphate isomerase/epimerase
MFGNSIAFEDYPIEQVIAIMAEVGFTGVEPWKPHLKRCRSKELCASLVEVASASGVRMGGLNVVGEPYYKPFGTERELEATLLGLQADIDFALSLGIRDVLIWEGIRPENVSDAYCRGHLLPPLIDLFRAALKYSAGKQARLLIEPHPFTVGMDNQFAIQICDALDSEYFGITYDFCHYAIGRPSDYIDSVRVLGRRIRHMHFADSDGNISELHFTPGQGCVDIPGLLRAFREIGYDGSITLDLYGNPTPIAAARSGIPQLREACEFLNISATATV